MSAPVSGLILLALELFQSVASFAVCGRYGYPSVNQEFETSKYVAEVLITRERHLPATSDERFLDGSEYELKVLTQFKGKARPTLWVFSENSSGRFPMDVNRKYLVFVYSKGRLQIDTCGNSARLQDSARALEALRKIASPTTP
jgi:hypothetical protein